MSKIHEIDTYLNKESIEMTIRVTIEYAHMAIFFFIPTLLLLWLIFAIALTNAVL